MGPVVGNYSCSMASLHNKDSGKAAWVVDVDNLRHLLKINSNKSNNLIVIGTQVNNHSIQYNTIQYNTIQYNTIQYNIMQYNVIQYDSNNRHGLNNSGINLCKGMIIDIS